MAVYKGLRANLREERQRKIKIIQQLAVPLTGQQHSTRVGTVRHCDAVHMFLGQAIQQEAVRGTKEQFALLHALCQCSIMIQHMAQGNIARIRSCQREIFTASRHRFRIFLPRSQAMLGTAVQPGNHLMCRNAGLLIPQHPAAALGRHTAACDASGINTSLLDRTAANFHGLLINFLCIQFHAILSGTVCC